MFTKVPVLIRRTQINARRRRGDNQVISERTGYSASHISNVLHRRRRNASILSKAWRMVRGRKLNSELV